MDKPSRHLNKDQASMSYGSFDYNNEPRKLNRPLSRAACGTEIAFHNVRYTVKVKIGGEKRTREILQGISGILRPGLNAILGPTGSGKTTLLDVVAGRKDKKYLSGHVLVDGERQPNNFKLISGYVVQEDCVLGTLTVRENLLFSAALRLPRNFTKQDREARVQMIIEDLGLLTVADCKVGTELIRGVSGGEKKRTSIGMELITSPDVLFLDEPTTGLDASTACSVMELLHMQARKGRNIILSIHQPRYSIYKLFDTLTLLSDGKIVYHGKTENALHYFGNFGFVCEQHNNPPDFFLDVINEETNAQKLAQVMENYHVLEEGGSSKAYTGPSLAQRYVKTELYQETLKAVRSQIEHLEDLEKTGSVSTTRAIEYQTSFFRQLAILTQRAARNNIRNPQTSIFQLLVNVVLALAVGGIYYNISKGPSGLQDRVGVFFFLATNVFFGSMSALELFIKERVIFIHESANGYYRVSSYFLAKSICDIVPLRLIPVIIFCSISYWMVGLEPDFVKFCIFTGGLGMVALAAAAMAFLISSCVSVFAVANLLMVLPAIVMLLFSGLLINLRTMTKYIRWLKYLSVVRYGLNILAVNELRGMTFHGCGVPGTNRTSVCQTGDEYLLNQGIKHSEIWYDFLAIGCIFVILLMITYIQLRRIKKEK